MYSVSLRLFVPAFAATILSIAVLFGGNFPLAQGALPIMCAIIWGLSLAVPASLPSGWGNRLLLAGVFLPILITLLWGAFQVLPLGAENSLRNPFWGLVTWPGAWGSISLAPGATLANLSYALGYTVFAFALYRVGQGHPRTLLVITVLIITVISFYGIIEFAGGNTMVLWLPKTSYGNSLTATFINRNSFATFAGLGTLASLALALQRVGEISQRLDFRQRIRAFWLLVLRPGWPWLCAAAVCFVALVLTNSRAGLASSLCGVLVLLGSLAGMRPPARWPLLAMLTGILLMALIVLGAVGGTLGNRLLQVSTDSETRQLIYQNTGTLITQYPVTGTGFGTYPQAISTARTIELFRRTPFLIDHAHNTYLELTSELGYPGAVLLGFASLCASIICLNGLITRRRAIIWPALGVATIVLVGGHALADFSLSIPAVTLVAITILMVAMAQSMAPREGETNPRTSRVTVLALAPLAVLLAVFAGWQTAANYHAFKADGTVRALLERRGSKQADIFLAQSHLMKCMEINPYHPTCAMDLAQTDLALTGGYGLTGPNSGVALVYLNMANQKFLNALTLSPANPMAWYRLSRINAYQGNTAAAYTYMANSLLTGPAEPYMAYPRIPYMLSLLPGADAENKTLFTANILGMWQSMPWQVAEQIRANPAIQPIFAGLLGDTPDNRAAWQRYIRMPFPVAQALGEPAQKR